MLFYNGKPHCVFWQLLFYCQMYARNFICLFVLSVYECQNNEQNHVTVVTFLMWYLAHVKNEPVILRYLVDMWFIPLGLCPRWINHISPHCLKITLTFISISINTDLIIIVLCFSLTDPISPRGNKAAYDFRAMYTIVLMETTTKHIRYSFWRLSISICLLSNKTSRRYFECV